MTKHGVNYWFIEYDNIRREYASWALVKYAWENITHGVLCRINGVVLDVK